VTDQCSAIEAHALSKSYGGVKVLDAVDLTVPGGTVFALLGPNGAGKTTIVRILATLLRPDGGQALVSGFDVVRQRAQVRRAISLTGQNVAIDELQTGAENLRMMARLAGMTAGRARRRALDLLDSFDLGTAGNRRVSTYSGGMRRRLDLAAGLVGRPAVLFLDEPTTGLDLPSRQALWQAVGDLVSAGVSVLLTTQYLEEADQLADRIAVINGGVVVAQGSPTELKSQIADQRLDLTLVDASAFDDVSRLLGGRVINSDPVRRTISLATDGSAAQIRCVLDEVDPHSRAVGTFALHVATLDDVFLALTGRPADQSDKEPAHV